MFALRSFSACGSPAPLTCVGWPILWIGVCISQVIGVELIVEFVLNIGDRGGVNISHCRHRRTVRECIGLVGLAIVGVLGLGLLFFMGHSLFVVWAVQPQSSDGTVCEEHLEGWRLPFPQKVVDMFWAFFASTLLSGLIVLAFNAGVYAYAKSHDDYEEIASKDALTGGDETSTSAADSFSSLEAV